MKEKPFVRSTLTPVSTMFILSFVNCGTSHTKNDRKMPEKAVYLLEEASENEFEKLMCEIFCSPINIFLDFNAVIVNWDSVSAERKAEYIGNIEKVLMI